MSRKSEITYVTVCILAKSDGYVSVQELAKTIYPGGNKTLEVQVHKAVHYMIRKGLVTSSEENVNIYDMGSISIKTTEKGLELARYVKLNKPVLYSV